MVGFDEVLALLNRELPGFGGLFYDEAGALNVYVVGGGTAGVAELFVFSPMENIELEVGFSLSVF